MADPEGEGLTFTSMQDELEYWKDKALEYKQK